MTGLTSAKSLAHAEVGSCSDLFSISRYDYLPVGNPPVELIQFSTPRRAVHCTYSRWRLDFRQSGGFDSAPGSMIAFRLEFPHRSSSHDDGPLFD